MLMLRLKTHFLSGISHFCIIVKIEARLRVGDYTIFTRKGNSFFLIEC
jgi:hypothetical protein